MMRVFAAALVLLFILAFPAGATSISWAFGCITSNDPSLHNCMIGESQFRVDVIGGELNPFNLTSMIGPDEVLFSFSNQVGEPASITDIYFDDGTLLALSSIYATPGVAFTQPATPGDLPGGNEVGFMTTASFSAGSSPPTAINGVNTSSEGLGILFTLQPDKTYADVIAALQSGDLRIGIHAQAIGSAPSTSESFVSTPNVEPAPKIPEPGTWMLLSLGLGLLGAGMFARRRFV